MISTIRSWRLLPPALQWVDPAAGSLCDEPQAASQPDPRVCGGHVNVACKPQTAAAQNTSEESFLGRRSVFDNRSAGAGLGVPWQRPCDTNADMETRSYVVGNLRRAVEARCSPKSRFIFELLCLRIRFLKGTSLHNTLHATAHSGASGDSEMGVIGLEERRVCLRELRRFFDFDLSDA